MDKFTKQDKTNGKLLWVVVSRNGKPAYHCQTHEAADKWIAIESKR